MLRWFLITLSFSLVAFFFSVIFFTFSILSSFLFSFLHLFFHTFFFYLFCSTFSRHNFYCSTEVKTWAFATGLILCIFFSGVAGKIKQSIYEGGTNPFLINEFKCCKSEVTEAATAEVEINSPGKLGWVNSDSTVGTSWWGVCVASASLVVLFDSTSNKRSYCFLHDLASVCFYQLHQG